MKRANLLILSILSLSILLLSLFAFRRYLPYTGIDLGPRRAPDIVMEMNDVYLVGLGHNGKVWSSRASSVEIGRSRTRTRITNLHDGKIFDKNRVVLKVKAGSGLYDTNTQNLWLSDGIQVTGNKGQRITASGADWNSAMQILRSKGRVVFENGPNKIYTDQLLLNLRNQQLDMWNVTIRFTVGDAINDLQETNIHAR